jgi:AcrR family transcriptional regulator
MGEALLTAAVEILEQEGPDALSVRRIAAHAGVAPMGVYNHFSSKFGIIDAVFILGFERLAEAMGSLNEIDDPVVALAEAGQEYRKLALAHPMTYEVMFLRPITGYEPSEPALEVAARAFDGLVAVIRRGMDRQVLSGSSPTTVAQVIWASIHGWMALELRGIGFVEDQAAGFNELCSGILRGLHPPA